MPYSVPRAELAAWLRLVHTPGLSNSALRALLQAHGDPERVLSASAAALRQHVSAEVADRIDTDNPLVEKALAWAEHENNHILTLGDKLYPPSLLQISNPPSLLYVKGGVHLLNNSALAIVGSRNATAQGVANAEDFARALSDAGLTVISGMAMGVDAAAHRGGLTGNSSSIAVVGTGLDIVYPARNRALAHELANKGVLVSEFALGTPAVAVNFPRRNRIISGLSLGCLVVEAALKSGSLITARYAMEQGREVFAIPGSIHSPLAKGCHQLIKQGAKLVDSVSDILEELAMSPATARALQATTSTPAGNKLLDAMGFEPTSLDALCARVGLASSEVSVQLLELELSGVIESLPGALYQRVR